MFRLDSYRLYGASFASRNCQRLRYDAMFTLNCCWLPMMPMDRNIDSAALWKSSPTSTSSPTTKEALSCRAAAHHCSTIALDGRGPT
ncbi:5-methylcytosine-specific restriction endonuclease domain protein [Burkholderia pseudomallei MSHR5596]|nr:5-methylcytosine-specific restriction endonuclease domain protein [Burkholderia pseudomallei MSHR5596]